MFRSILALIPSFELNPLSLFSSPYLCISKHELDEDFDIKSFTYKILLSLIYFNRDWISL